uniref:G-protein coupled receptors family 1 profile domain-containing protein n=1 Tax=Ditylenchus dipsaci TaxID=166011 RepID=A0A915DF95_9BILA
MTGPGWPFGERPSEVSSLAFASSIVTEVREDNNGVGVGLGLAIVNLLVVCGNVFVLYILISQKSLRSSTNDIVISLTLSDFLLGVIILPFSILQEYSLSWMFGEVWCKVWLALDVLLSTASIYNLLAISFDRYMAVRQPIKYKFISSNKMTKITIAVVWLIASLLAFPPLVYDHFGVAPPSIQSRGGQCTPATSNDWYILFSAFVSFILPMFLMLGLNFSIFYTVNDSTKLTKLPTSNKSSFLVNNSSVAAVSTEDVSRTHMRIHRGGTFNNGSLRKSNYINLSQSQRSLNQLKKIHMIQRDCHSVERNSSICSTRKQTMDSIVVASNNRLHSLERTDTFSTSLESPASGEYMSGNGYLQRQTSTLSEAKATWLARVRAISMEKRQQLMEAASERQSFHSTNSSLQSNPFSDYTHRFYLNNQGTACASPPIIVTEDMDSTTGGQDTPVSISTLCPGSYQPPPLHTQVSKTVPLMEKTADQAVWYPAVVGASLLAGHTTQNRGQNQRKNTVSSYCRKQSEKLLLYPVFQHTFNRSISIRTELKVARTIAIVVGCFTACWLPFTVIYVLQAFQTCPVGSCVPPWFFTLAFWLGYANSAINPLIYSAFSKDFRRAFKKVLMERGSSFRSY